MAVVVIVHLLGILHRRAIVTRIADAIPVGVMLIGIGRGRTIVFRIRDTIVVHIRGAANAASVGAGAWLEALVWCRQWP